MGLKEEIIRKLEINRSFVISGNLSWDLTSCGIIKTVVVSKIKLRAYVVTTNALVSQEFSAITSTEHHLIIHRLHDVLACILVRVDTTNATSIIVVVKVGLEVLESWGSHSNSLRDHRLSMLQEIIKAKIKFVVLDAVVLFETAILLD